MSARPTITANEVFSSNTNTESWAKWSGQVVQGKFHLEEFLGASERSAVFRAKSADQTPANVAIKLSVAKPASADAQLALWKQAANFSHPHVLRIFQWGRCEMDGVKLLYVVTEYAEENLAQILPQRALTPEETKQMLPAVLDGLAYIHGKGFVHGHLRPSNILVVNDQLKLSSDGIARINEPTGGKRSSYDPPEIATMTTSTAGDVWSLGMVLAETLTQKLPAVDVFKIDNPKQKDPVVTAFIPEPFREIISNCLRTNPQQRWTIERLAAYLKSPSSAQGAAETAATPRERSAKRELANAAPASESHESSGKRGLFLLVAAVVLVVAIVAAVMLHNSHPATAPATQTAAQEQQAPSPSSSVPQVTNQQSSIEQQGTEQATQPLPVGQQSTPAPSAATPNNSTTAGVIHQVIPEASPGARRTVHGKVRVQVRAFVDEAGNVTRTAFDSHGPSNYFAGLAENAAGQWKFVPAQANGQNVSSEWVLKFAFGRKGTEVSPGRANSK
jgi:eukaryotic-like serine/threonine-protein kinase